MLRFFMNAKNNIFFLFLFSKQNPLFVHISSCDKAILWLATLKCSVTFAMARVDVLQANIEEFWPTLLSWIIYPRCLLKVSLLRPRFGKRLRPFNLFFLQFFLFFFLMWKHYPLRRSANVFSCSEAHSHTSCTLMSSSSRVFECSLQQLITVLWPLRQSWLLI